MLVSPSSSIVSLPLGDLLAGEVDADEPALRRRERHGDEVAAAGAAQLEHAAAVWQWWVEAEQGRQVARWSGWDWGRGWLG